MAQSGYPVRDSRPSLYTLDEDLSSHTLVHTIERQATSRGTNQLLIPPLPGSQNRSSRSPDGSYAQRLYASAVPKQKRTSVPPQGTHRAVHSPPPSPNVHRARHANSSRADHQVETLRRAISSESFHVSPPPPSVGDSAAPRNPVSPSSDYHEETSKSSKMASLDYGASSSSQDYALEDHVPAYEIPTPKIKSPKIPEEPVQVTVDSPPAESSTERPRSIPGPPPQTNLVESGSLTEDAEESAEEAPPYTLVDEAPPPPPPSVEDAPTETESRNPSTTLNDALPRAPAYNATDSRSPVEPPLAQSPLSHADNTPPYHLSSAVDGSHSGVPAYTAGQRTQSTFHPADNLRHPGSTPSDSLPRAAPHYAPELPSPRSPASPDSTARRVCGPRRLSSVSTLSTTSSVVSGLAVDLYGSAYGGFRHPQREHTLPQATSPQPSLPRTVSPHSTHSNPMFPLPPPAMYASAPVPGARESVVEFPAAPHMPVPLPHVPHNLMPGHFSQPQPQPHPHPQPQYAPDGRPLNPNTTAPVNAHPPPPEWQRVPPPPPPPTGPPSYTSRKLRKPRKQPASESHRASLVPPQHSSSSSLAHAVPQHYLHGVSQQQQQHQQAAQRLQKRAPGPRRPSTAPSVSSLSPAERWAQQPPMPSPW